MIRGIIITVLTLGVIGTGAWGYQEHREKNAILMNAENNYQRAFHDLAYQMDTLHDKIGTTLAMNSRKSLSPVLADVWRLTSEAHNNVGQLPLTLLPFNKTEEFLSNIGKFSYRTAVRDLDKEPLTKDEYGTLKKLYSQSANIQDELRKVQHLVLKNNLRWMDVEMALATGKEASDNTIIDGFKTVEKTVKGYDESNMTDPSLMSYQKKNQNFEDAPGKKISKEEAIQIAKKFTNKNNLSKVKVTESGKGSKFGFFSVTFVDSNGNEGNIDITKKGGHPIYFIERRDIAKQKLSLNEGMNSAKKFIENNHIKNMEEFETTQYDTIGVYSFVTVENGIRIYPETLKIKTALDNGEIVGFTAQDLLKNKKKRNIPNPKLSKKEAKKHINPNLKIMEDRRSLIVNDLGKEVLCYEFLGTLNNDTYRIFINADSGVEEKVEKLKNAEKVYENTL
ncbi:germination protein YpeB [Heyndrickxia sporothermodurans]|uniref:germination protein YpeB n=1 Tax=Heyndrickxia sporothermodurans TaxID=46224 RepID=UPI002E230636|nr:germination protein YpeB [Heyndrickxia sporothermodurans]MED3780907.1 germination protein YpeB [Heyndrickxia sporothermodurans]